VKKGPSLSGPQKAAALLLTLDSEAAASVLSTLPDDAITMIGKAMADLDMSELSKEHVADLHKEFLQGLRDGATIPPGLAELLERTVGQERGKEILSRIEDSVRRDHPFLALERMEDARLVRLLADEHPQVIALVCSRIPAERAGSVLSAISEEERVDIVTRMAAMQPIEREVVDQIANALAAKAKEQEAIPVDDLNRRMRSVAEALSAADPDVEKEILTALDAKNADMAKEIRDRMFTFADLAKLDKRAMQRVLATVDARQLALALKAADPEVVENFYSNMTKRTREAVEEELQLMGPVPLTDVLNAQNEMMIGIRAMVEKGEIKPMRGSASNMV